MARGRGTAQFPVLDVLRERDVRQACCGHYHGAPVRLTATHESSTFVGLYYRPQGEGNVFRSEWRHVPFWMNTSTPSPGWRRPATDT